VLFQAEIAFVFLTIREQNLFESVCDLESRVSGRLVCRQAGMAVPGAGMSRQIDCIH
jgi:hypothetical protein